MKRRMMLFVAALGFSPAAALAQVSGSLEQQAFVYNDWVIGCDNTGRCRAVGHNPELDETDAAQAVAFMIERPAGPHSQVSAQFKAAGQSAGAGFDVWIDQDKYTPALRAETSLPPDLLEPLLKRMVRAQSARFRSPSGDERTLSLAGMKAALLKMDALQGRAETPGALIARGNRPEAAVPAARPAPRVKSVRLLAANPAEQPLAESILSGIQRDCTKPNKGHAVLRSEVRRVSPTHVLLVAECSVGTRQSTYNVYLANDRPPFQARELLFPISGDTSLADLLDPRFEGSYVGSDEGDERCHRHYTWAWTGSTFMLAHDSIAPLCRGLPQGGYPLQLFTASESAQ